MNEERDNEIIQPRSNISFDQLVIIVISIENIHHGQPIDSENKIALAMQSFCYLSSYDDDDDDDDDHGDDGDEVDSGGGGGGGGGGGVGGGDDEDDYDDDDDDDDDD